MTVQNVMKIVWTVFEKFELFMKRSGEKKQKKQHDCISSRKFFPTPKNDERNANHAEIKNYSCLIFLTEKNCIVEYTEMQTKKEN